MEWLALAALAAIVGLVVTGLWTFTRHRTNGVITRRRSDRRAALDLGKAQQLQIAYFQKKGLAGELYRTSELAPGTVVPILFSDVGDVTVEVPRTGPGPVHFEPAPTEAFRVDDAHITRRRKLGANVWDGEILHLVPGSALATESALLTARTSTYYSYLSEVARIEQGLGTSLWRGRTELPARFHSLSLALAGEPPSVWLASPALTVFHTPDGPRCLFQQRSSNVVSAPNAWAVVPTFGLERPAGGGIASRRNVLYYNYAKEFGEELFDVQEVEHLRDARQVDPDWFFDEPSVKALDAAADRGRLRLRLVGFGVAPRDATLVVGILAELDCDDEMLTLMNRMVGNWETKAAPLLISPFDTWLDELAASGALFPPSVFVLDRARSLLRARLLQEGADT